MKTYLHKSIVAAAAVLIWTAGSAAAQVASVNVIDPDAGFADVTRQYTDLDERYARDGHLRNTRRFQEIRTGTAQGDVLRLLGQPISRGAQGVWDYNVKFRLVNNNTIVCQYKVFFDEAGRVERSAWRRTQCAELASR